MASYSEQYMEKKSATNTPVASSRLKLDLSSVNEDEVAKINTTGFSDSMQSGDMSFDKTPARSKIPVSKTSLSKIPVPASRTPIPSTQEIITAKLEKRLRNKEAESTRLTGELKTVKESLTAKVRETVKTARDASAIRQQNETLSAELERTKLENVG